MGQSLFQLSTSSNRTLAIGGSGSELGDLHVSSFELSLLFSINIDFKSSIASVFSISSADWSPVTLFVSIDTSVPTGSTSIFAEASFPSLRIKSGSAIELLAFGPLSTFFADLFLDADTDRVNNGNDHLFVKGGNSIFSARDLTLSCFSGTINITTDSSFRSVRDLNITSFAEVYGSGSSLFLADAYALGSGRLVFSGSRLVSALAASLVFVSSDIVLSGTIQCAFCHLVFSPSKPKSLQLGALAPSEQPNTFDLSTVELSLLETNQTLTIGGFFASNVVLLSSLVATSSRFVEINSPSESLGLFSVYTKANFQHLYNATFINTGPVVLPPKYRTWILGPLSFVPESGSGNFYNISLFCSLGQISLNLSSGQRLYSSPDPLTGISVLRFSAQAASASFALAQIQYIRPWFIMGSDTVVVNVIDSSNTGSIPAAITSSVDISASDHFQDAMVYSIVGSNSIAGMGEGSYSTASLFGNFVPEDLRV